MASSREQALFSAAQLYRELHPVNPVLWFRKDTESYKLHQAQLAAQQQLDTALAAYEGKATS